MDVARGTPPCSSLAAEKLAGPRARRTRALARRSACRPSPPRWRTMPSHEVGYRTGPRGPHERPKESGHRGVRGAAFLSKPSVDERLEELRARCRPQPVPVLGSRARGHALADCDLDLLVASGELPQPVSRASRPCPDRARCTVRLRRRAGSSQRRCGSSRRDGTPSSPFVVRRPRARRSTLAAASKPGSHPGTLGSSRRLFRNAPACSYWPLLRVGLEPARTRIAGTPLSGTRFPKYFSATEN